MTMVGASATSFPLAETILSIGMTALATRSDRTSKKTRRLVARDNAGIGVAMIASDGLSNSTTASGGGRSRAGSWSVTPDISRTRRGIGISLELQVAVLLEPETTIDRAAIEKFSVRADIDHRSAVQHERLVTID